MTPTPGDHELTLIHEGVPREYLLHAPSAYDPAQSTALVLALHGRPSSASSLSALTELSGKADEAGFVAVFPQGLGGGWNADSDLVPSSPISLITITGTADAGVDDLSAQVLAGWQEQMRCGEPVKQTRDVGGGRVTTSSTECAAGTAVVRHSVHGMGHAWPGGLGGSSAPISANDVIWEFFEANQRPG